MKRQRFPQVYHLLLHSRTNNWHIDSGPVASVHAGAAAELRLAQQLLY